jgi:hypothetical protein
MAGKVLRLGLKNLHERGLIDFTVLYVVWDTHRMCLVDRSNSDFPTPIEILLFGRPVLSPGHCPTHPEKAS